MQSPIRLHATSGAEIAGYVVGARVVRIGVHRDFEEGAVLIGRALRTQQTRHAHKGRIHRRPAGDPLMFLRRGTRDERSLTGEVRMQLTTTATKRRWIGARR